MSTCPASWARRAGSGAARVTLRAFTREVNLATAAPAPFLPEAVRGKPVAIVSGCYAGNPAEGARIFRPLKEFGSPVADLIGPMPYTAMHTLVDGQWGPRLPQLLQVVVAPATRR